MEEEIKEPEKSGVIRDEQGRFINGVSGNINGRPSENQEQKLRKKASKELIANYKDKLAEVLPQLSVILINKAMGKPQQSTDITSGERPIPLLDFIRDRKE